MHCTDTPKKKNKKTLAKRTPTPFVLCHLNKGKVSMRVKGISSPITKNGFYNFRQNRLKDKIRRCFSTKKKK